MAKFEVKSLLCELGLDETMKHLKYVDLGRNAFYLQSGSRGFESPPRYHYPFRPFVVSLQSIILLSFIVCPCNMIDIFIITNTMHTIGVDKITLFKTT